ncbi:hypothetical protein KR009_004984 [Drosophila setifemur]|nr:hypothetical protein KR009_004984 [Drosophila setifemur]
MPKVGRKKPTKSAPKSVEEDAIQLDRGGSNGDTGSFVSSSTGSSNMKRKSKRKGKSMDPTDSSDSDDVPLNGKHQKNGTKEDNSAAKDKKRKPGRPKKESKNAPKSVEEDAIQLDREGSSGDTGSFVSSSTRSSNMKRKSKRKGKSMDPTDSSDSDDEPLNGKHQKNGTKEDNTAAEVEKRKRGRGRPKRLVGAKNGRKSTVNADEDVAKEPRGKQSEEMEYEVEAIVGHKTVHGVQQYKVRWKGYDASSDSWVTHLNCDELIAQYKEKSKDKKGRPSGAPLRGQRSRAPTTHNESDVWEIEKILDFVEDDEYGNLFHIRWKGFGPKDDTWEPEENISNKNLIRKFKRELERRANVELRELREAPKKTKRLVNECYPRTDIRTRIQRSSKRAAAKNRVFYGED